MLTNFKCKSTFNKSNLCKPHLRKILYKMSNCLEFYKDQDPN